MFWPHHDTLWVSWLPIACAFAHATHADDHDKTRARTCVMQVLGMGEEEQFWFTMYGVSGLLTTGAYILSSSVFMLSAVAASRNFHNRIFNSVLRGSVNLFFDVQPLGRILNRFSADMDRLGTWVIE